MRTIRKQLTGDERGRQAIAAARALLVHPLIRPMEPGHVLVPTTFRHELPTEAIAAALETEGWTIVRPRADAMHTRIHAIAWDTSQPLVEGYAGILEPPEDAGPSVAADRLDVVLVPGSAFDTRGGRLGAGVGFFDRFLAPVTSARRPVRIGIGFAQQLVDQVPMEPHDVPMHGLQLGPRSIVCQEPT